MVTTSRTRVEDTAEYRAWVSIRRRCADPETPYYPKFGGRGVRVCGRWDRSFWAFLGDVGPQPTPFHRLGRVRREGDYEPGNCGWVAREGQPWYTRRDRVVVFDGARRTLGELYRIYGVSRRQLVRRLRGGATLAEAFREVAPSA